MCCSDAYIVVKWRMSAGGANDANKRNKKLTFKNNAPFRSCISKINRQYRRSWYCYANI